MTANAMHLCEDSEKYTPPKIIEAVREVLGNIDLDPASTLFVNEKLVKADKFFSMEDDGLKQDWYGNVFVNPPSQVNGEGQKGKGPKLFWKRLTDELRDGKIIAGIYLGYSFEQLNSLQNAGTIYHPLDFITCIYKGRINFMKYDSDKEELVEMKQPTHGNFLTLVTRSTEKKRKFKEIFGKFGKVVQSAPKLSYPFDIME